MIKGLGWKPPLPNAHKRWFEDHCQLVKATPPSIDMESLCPPVYDQGNLGSCTANSTGGMAEFLVMKLGLWNFMPARLALYYWTRLGEGDPTQDNGASVQDAAATLNTWGVPNESLWWYNTAKFAVKPNHNVVNDASKHKCAAPMAISQDANSLKNCLAMGYPFVFGFTVYSSFENIGSDGIMPMPKSTESILGGHAVMAVGYDDSTQYFKVRNSWGASWGKNGYFFMPYTYILNNNYASDFWTCHSVVELP